MVYEAGNRKLNCIRKIMGSAVNEVWVCEDMGSNAGIYYTLLIIREHETARRFLKVLSEGERQGKKACLDLFTRRDIFYVLYEYQAERPLRRFFMGKACSKAECEEICVNIVMECLASSRPWPILYLLLEQDQLNIGKDNKIYFSYALDMQRLRSKWTEQDCVQLCARMLRSLLEENPAAAGSVGYSLIDKRVAAAGYTNFAELYRDIRMITEAGRKVTWRERLYALWDRYRDRIFRVFTVASLMLGTLVLLMVISQLFFGDIPFMRIFTNSFKRIGTESLVK